MQFSLAINNTGAHGIPLAVAINIELNADGTIPDWIPLIPAGLEVKGRDGRWWINDKPEDIVAAFIANAMDLPIDWEHATEHKAPWGDPAPAAGWVKEMVIRNGEVWGRVEWTAKACAQIAAREYRFTSPAILFDKENRRIVRITSIGLTNQPNFFLPSLNTMSTNKEKDSMELAKLLALLGLAATATFEQALNHIAEIKQNCETAINRANHPPLDQFVPRADYDKALERATNSETRLKEKETLDLEKDINTEIGAALKKGVITPATADYHRTNCRAEGGLVRFKTFAASAPVIGPASGLDGNLPDTGTGAIDDVQRAINQQCGIDDETYLKNRATEKK